MATFANDRGVIMEDPVYDSAFNTMEAKKIAVDGIDDGGGKIYIDLDQVKVFEPISLPKMEQVRSFGNDNTVMQRIKAAIELKAVVSKGREIGVVQGGAEEEKPQAKGSVGPIRAVPPPAR